MTVKASAGRVENRLPMSVAVHLWSQGETSGIETAFTENVSSRGVRLVSFRHWRTEQRVAIALLPGDFSAIARVAYCHFVRGTGFAVGLEFLEPRGQWVLNPAACSE